MTVPSFIFGGNTGRTYDDIKRERERIEAMAPRQMPQTFGQGLSYLGAALANRIGNSRLDREEKAGREEFNSVFQDLIANKFGGASPGAASAPPAPNGIDAFNASLAKTESGGNYDARNVQGYTGKYQFGQERLDDFNRAAGTRYTTDDLLKSPQLQEKVQAWHVGDIDDFIQRNGLDKFVGQTVGGATITHDGMRAMAHLGGKGGMLKFLQSGGQYNPGDANGTNLSNYASRHAGAGTSVATHDGGAPANAGGLGVDPRLFEAMGNGYATPGQRALMELLIKRQMAQNAPVDPMKQLQMERLRLQNEQLRNPVEKPTERGLQPQYGVDENGAPVLLQLGKDGTAVQTSMPDGVTLSKQPIKLDAGTHYVLLDPITRQPVGQIPKELAEAEKQKVVGKADGASTASAEGDLRAGQNALDLIRSIREDPNRERGTGFSSILNAVPGTPGYDFQKKVEQARSGAFLSAIQQLRGMGALSNAEGQAATAAVTRMVTSMSEEGFLDALADYEKIVRQGVVAAHGRLPDGRSQGAPAAVPDQSGALQKARDAIAKGASREAVIERLRAAGVDPKGL